MCLVPLFDTCSRIYMKLHRLKYLGKFFLRATFIEAKKPVHWSPSSSMALAKAELEYPEGHIPRSVYVIFKVVNVVDIAPNFLKGLLPSLVWLSRLRPYGQFLQIVMPPFYVSWTLCELLQYYS